MATVYLALGSNLGNREKFLQDAIAALTAIGIQVLQRSSVIETESVGGPPQDKYLNMALKATTSLHPGQLLNEIQTIESNLGRVRDIPNGPRTIDIDILLYDNQSINTKHLTIPHPRMWERPFVTIPLKEIAPDLIKQGKP